MTGRLLVLLRGSSLQRASSLRHLAMVAALGVAWFGRRQFQVTNQSLWILGTAAGLNFAIGARSPRARADWTRAAQGVSVAVGLTCWAALASLSGGARSPFIAGLWLEIAFSALVFPPAGTLIISGAAGAALWAAALWPGASVMPFDWPWPQTGVTWVFGATTFLASKRWAQRLGGLEAELDASRQLVSLGESVARVAHGLKNSVHSLRGFTQLIEAAHARADSSDQAIAGLHLAIDRLEDVARTTLRPPPAPTLAGTAAHPRSTPRSWISARDLERTMDEVIDEVGRRHRAVRWVHVRAGAGLGGVGLTPSELREVLLALAENAAEASGAGEVTVQATTDRGMLNLVVRDHGPGLPAAIGDRLFDLGATTKPTGHGFGLFLARRLVESQGGRLTAEPARGGGAQFSVMLPLSRT